MVFVGIDVAKDKHNCFVVNSDGEVLFDVFTIQNNMDGFKDLLFKIKSAEKNVSNIKVGLEATGHYSYNYWLRGLYCFTILLRIMEIAMHFYSHIVR